MKKLITLLVTIAMIGVMLTGCGGSGKEVTADPAKLAEDLSKTASGDTLSSISEDILASTYLVDTSKIDSCAAYVGTGATACEAVVIKCSDSSYVSEVKGLFETRVKNQSDLYSSYNADEVKNLDNAIIKTSGNYAVLCVTNDTAAAEKVLKEAGLDRINHNLNSSRSFYHNICSTHTFDQRVFHQRSFFMRR